MEKPVGKMQVVITAEALNNIRSKDAIIDAYGKDLLHRLVGHAMTMPEYHEAVGARIRVEVSAFIDYNEVELQCPMCGTKFSVPAENTDAICACGARYAKGAGWMYKKMYKRPIKKEE